MVQYENLCSYNYELNGKEGIVDLLKRDLKNKEKSLTENKKWKDIIRSICEKAQMIQEKLLKNQCVIIQSGGPDFKCVVYFT